MKQSFMSLCLVPFFPVRTERSASTPETEGDAGGDGEQGNEHHHAAGDHNSPSLLLLGPLKLQPFQVTELTALPNVAWYATATCQRQGLFHNLKKKDSSRLILFYFFNLRSKFNPR